MTKADRARAYQRRRYARQRAAGQCCACGCAEPALPEQTLCAEHAEDNRFASRKHQAARKAAGLCIDCSTKNGLRAATRGLRCDVHADRAAARTTAWRASRAGS